MAEAGYEVAVRTNVWSECLVQRGPERWLGRGADEEQALEDALAQILPSYLGRMLLRQRLGAGAARMTDVQPTPVFSTLEVLVITPSAMLDGTPRDAGARALTSMLEAAPPRHAPGSDVPSAEPAATAEAVTTAIEPAVADAAREEAPPPVAQADVATPEPAPAPAAPPEAARGPQASAAPVADAPVADAPVADAPVAAAPVADAPVVAAPVVAAPVVAAPVVAAPAEALPPILPSKEPAAAPIPLRPREVEIERPARLRASDALDAVEKMMTAIEDRLPALARMCADRQRLNMLVWICRARSIEESLPGVRDVEHAVARVARRLTDIGKTFWPGSVRALQLSARPADVRREMHANWASEPTNWVEATRLAERLLDEHLQKSNDAGLDEDGWADVAARTPRPADPDVAFEEVDNELKTMLSATGEVPNGKLAELSAAEIDALINAARRLRWVRGAVKDDLAWGTAMGRLRRSLPGLGDRASRIKETLDNRFKPAVSWARLLGEGGEGPTSAVTETPEKLKADLPGALESKETLMAWLIRAFDVLNTPVLVEIIPPARALLSTFGEEELNHSDRRVRRRLRDLVKRLAEVDAAPPKEAPKPVAAAPEPEAPSDEPMAPGEIDILSQRVRAQTEGRRALFVSNREDPELGSRLSDLLGITIAWCDGSLRRVQAQCERIQRGSYDLILSATGFQVHGVDSALARAAGAAGVPYVRVNRGRPVACVQAIAREFGLLTQTVPVPVRKAAS